MIAAALGVLLGSVIGVLGFLHALQDDLHPTHYDTPEENR